MTILVDGTGKGYEAKVDQSNRLWTKSISITEQGQYSLDGYGYNLNTGEISITADTESALAYLKYNGATKIHVDALAVGVGKAASSTDSVKITMIRNPTGGTIVDNAVVGDQNQNRNFGSTRVLLANWYKGVLGDTLTGGAEIATFYQGHGGRLYAGIDFILESSNTLGLKIQPNSTATFNIYLALICHEESE